MLVAAALDFDAQIYSSETDTTAQTLLAPAAQAQ